MGHSVPMTKCLLHGTLPNARPSEVCTGRENRMIKSRILVSGSPNSAPGSWVPAQAEFEDTGGVLLADKSPKTLSTPHPAHNSK